jgi:hypothetical protein
MTVREQAMDAARDENTKQAGRPDGEGALSPGLGNPPAHPYQLGWDVAVQPVPPIEEATKYVRAGTIDIGVGFRTIQGQVNDSGVSLHVLDHATREEWLRFDLFDANPHYHYIRPDTMNTVVRFDEFASGPPLEWAVRCLRNSISGMLRHAGAFELADRVDGDAIEQSLPALLTLVNEALAADPR